MTCTRAYAQIVLVVLVALGACRHAAPETFTATAFDADVRVLPNGSAEVVEAIAVAFAGPASGFERVIAYDTADGLTFVSASLDGRELVRDAADGVKVEPHGDRELRVRWTFPPAPDASRTFGLRYIVVAASAIQGARGSLRLPVIPANRSYPIEFARVSLTLPASAALFSGSGIAEAGWRVERQPVNGITAQRRDLPPAEPTTVVAEFSVDPAAVLEPRWHADRRWGELLMPAFLSGGLFILVVGAGVLWITRFQYPPSRREGDGQERLAVRTGLRNGGLVTIVVALGSAAVAWFTLSHLGPWAMAVPVSILIVGVVFVTVSRWWV